MAGPHPVDPAISPPAAAGITTNRMRLNPHQEHGERNKSRVKPLIVPSKLPNYPFSAAIKFGWSPFFAPVNFRHRLPTNLPVALARFFAGGTRSRFVLVLLDCRVVFIHCMAGRAIIAGLLERSRLYSLVS